MIVTIIVTGIVTGVVTSDSLDLSVQLTFLQI
jgi:hypothetical protein